MNNSILNELQTTEDPIEKAAIAAEHVFSLLPQQTAFMARQCVILHWFDQSLLQEMSNASQDGDQPAEIYRQIISLPFIEVLEWGASFHDITREGLLKRYAVSRLELLVHSAQLAASIYLSRDTYGIAAAEAFFCYLVAGDSTAALELLEALLKEALHREDWQYINCLKQLQDEAEKLPFVKPLILAEYHWLARGLAHRAQNKLENAIIDYSKAISSNSANALTYKLRGATHAELEKYEDALADYERALEMEPTAEVYINLGAIYFKQGVYTKSVLFFTDATSLDPNKAMDCYNLGIALYKLNQYEEALSVYENALLYITDNPAIYNDQGLVLDKLKKYEDALTAYKQALYLDPNHAIAHYNSGIAFFKLGRYKLALEAYEKALQFNSEYALAYHNKGMALYKLNRFEEALIAYDKALSLNPNLSFAYNDKGVVLDKFGQYEEALAMYEEALRLDLQYVVAHNNRGVALHKLGRYAEALAAYAEALRLDPQYVIAHNNRGVVLHKLGRYAEALAAYEEALRLDFTYTLARDNRFLTKKYLEFSHIF